MLSRSAAVLFAAGVVLTLVHCAAFTAKDDAPTPGPSSSSSSSSSSSGASSSSSSSGASSSSSSGAVDASSTDGSSDAAPKTCNFDVSAGDTLGGLCPGAPPATSFSGGVDEIEPNESPGQTVLRGQPICGETTSTALDRFRVSVNVGCVWIDFSGNGLDLSISGAGIVAKSYTSEAHDVVQAVAGGTLVLELKHAFAPGAGYKVIVR